MGLNIKVFTNLNDSGESVTDATWYPTLSEGSYKIEDIKIYTNLKQPVLVRLGKEGVVEYKILCSKLAEATTAAY